MHNLVRTNTGDIRATPHNCIVRGLGTSLCYHIVDCSALRDMIRNTQTISIMLVTLQVIAAYITFLILFLLSDKFENRLTEYLRTKNLSCTRVIINE